MFRTSEQAHKVIRVVQLTESFASPMSTSWRLPKALFSDFPMTKLNRNGDGTLVEHSSFRMDLIVHCILLRDSRYVRIMIVTDPGNFCWRALNSTIRSTDSKAPFKSRKTTNVGRKCLWVISNGWQREETWSMQPRPVWNAARYWRAFLSWPGVRLLTNTEFKTNTTTGTKLIPWELLITL